MSIWNFLYGVALSGSCLGLGVFYLIPMIARSIKTEVWIGGGFTWPKSARPRTYWTAVVTTTLVTLVAVLVGILGFIGILQKAGFLPSDPL